MSPRAWRLVVLVSLLAAVVVRWPVSFWPGAMPLDPNTPLHALVARQLALDGSLSHLSRLDYPDGIWVRYTAWPVLLLAAPIIRVWGAVVGLNLAVLAWLVAQGVGVGWLGSRLGWSLAARLGGAVAVIAAPINMLFLGNGQLENVAWLPLVVVFWGGLRGGRVGWVWAALGVLGAAFSSPYQGVVAAVVLGAASLSRGWRAWLAAALALLPGFLLAFLYYSMATDEQISTLAHPAMGAWEESAVLDGLAFPRAHGLATRRSLGARLGDALAGEPEPQPLGAWWPFTTPRAASYLGVGLMGLGLVGLWRSRERPAARAAALFGGLCLVLALGSVLQVSVGGVGLVWLPWAWLSRLPGLDAMRTPLRFLTGTGLALLVGLGFVLSASRGRWVALVGMLLLIDGLLVSPASWPVEAARPAVADIQAQIVPGPIALWTARGALSAPSMTVVALLLERPLAVFVGRTDGGEENAPGYQPPPPDINLHGELPSQWLERVAGAGVGTVLVWRDRSGRAPTPPQVTAGLGLRVVVIGKRFVQPGVPTGPPP